jgi:hypothetical protein
MTPKMMQRYHRKGIFTVHQLSYVFKPRRGRKRAKKPPVRFNVELQALAAYSARRLPLIPVELCHRFQSKVATDSD